MPLIRHARYRFWRALAAVLGRAFRFCRERQARCCNCIACWFTLNGRRVANEMIDDAIRAEAGQPKIDRRPS